MQKGLFVSVLGVYIFFLQCTRLLNLNNFIKQAAFCNNTSLAFYKSDSKYPLWINMITS